jgi:hypothetical protein
MASCTPISTRPISWRSFSWPEQGGLDSLAPCETSEPIVPLGSEVLVKEAEVDQAFASGRIDDASLTAKVTAESRLCANKAVSAAVANSESCGAVDRDSPKAMVI